MKLKSRPDDFQVEELTDVQTAGGRFAFYRLTKRSLATDEAVAAIARRWRLAIERISVGGLKDKYALTTQYLSIESGPPRSLRQTNLTLDYLGQLPRPFESNDIRANRFRVVLRDLAGEQCDRALAAVLLVERDGVPNYFDLQRFGSLGSSGKFMAVAWVQRDYEQACRIVLADALPGDSAAVRREREEIATRWGEWRHLAAQFHSQPRHDVLAHLARQPLDFRGALARLPHFERRMDLAALQSEAWNRLCGTWLVQRLRPEQRIEVQLRPGARIFYTALDDAQRSEFTATRLPLPTSRTRLPEGPLADIADHVLGQFGLSWRRFRIDYPRDSFFSKGDRALVAVPGDLRIEAAEDDWHTGRRKLTLAFELTRGAYATNVVRRLLLEQSNERS